MLNAVCPFEPGNILISYVKNLSEKSDYGVLLNINYQSIRVPTFVAFRGQSCHKTVSKSFQTSLKIQ